jgi:hypothetical protein
MTLSVCALLPHSLQVDLPAQQQQQAAVEAEFHQGSAMKEQPPPQQQQQQRIVDQLIPAMRQVQVRCFGY